MRDKTKVKRRNSIAFQDEVEIKEIKPVSAMVDTGTVEGKLWHSAEDFRSYRNELAEAVFLHQRKSRKAGCVRGGEHYLSKDNKNAARNSIHQILALQKKQKKAGQYNDEELREAYASACSKSAKAALKQATKDYDEVKSKKRNGRMARRSSM